MARAAKRTNTTAGPVQDKATSVRWPAVAFYALLSLISLAITLGVGWWIATQADLLGVRFDRAYYVLLVILGLSAALMLFGAMRSAARVKGQYLGVAFDVGGPAALFVLVVVGGAWLTQPPASFNAKVRLRYAGPEIDRMVYDAAVPGAKLRAYVGLGTYDYPVSHQGEVMMLDLPGRFRDGQFGVELMSDRIILIDHDSTRRIAFPGPDQVAEVRAALKEPPERRAARDEARAALTNVVAAIQKILASQDKLLFPAIDAFLISPRNEADAAWQRVLDEKERTRKEVERGIEAALTYEARWGGLLGPAAQQVRADLASATRDPLQGKLPSQLDELFPTVVERGIVLKNVPDPKVTADVIAWRGRLKVAYEKVLDALKPLAERLKTPS